MNTTQYCLKKCGSVPVYSGHDYCLPCIYKEISALRAEISVLQKQNLDFETKWQMEMDVTESFKVENQKLREALEAIRDMPAWSRGTTDFQKFVEQALKGGAG